MIVQGDGLQPGRQIQGERDDRDPDPVGVETLERQVAQSGVFRVADAVLPKVIFVRG